MTDPLHRPIGWWLKEADARLDAAFARELAAFGVDRRGWQVLASLAAGPSTREQLAAALAPFDAPDVVDGVVDGLATGGWVSESDAGLQLTPEGAERRRQLAARVGTIRDRVGDALPGDDYVTLVRLLQRLVEAFEPAR
ncbi:MAG TPA: hypothetical protein VN213_11315 [Solirubrobacteraceae bacterium]|nr:hypothetical protein [Solirubrobacteraceae bacterium]